MQCSSAEGTWIHCQKKQDRGKDESQPEEVSECMNYEKMMVSALCAAALALAGCAAVSVESDPTATPAASAASTAESIPNPMIQCESAAEAGKAAGFDFAVPEKIGGYEIVSYLAVKDSFAEANYMSEEDQMMIRKGQLTEGNDISGDYTEYPESQTITVPDGDKQITVSTRGENGLYHVAVWGDDTSSYAISSNNGLDATTLEQIMEQYWAASAAAATASAKG